MGILKSLNRWRKKELTKVRAYGLAKELTLFYERHFVSPWQKSKVDEIRAMYEVKQKNLGKAYDIASSRLSEEFMMYELEYLRASESFKKDNPSKEWVPDGVRGYLTKAFWRNLFSKPQLATSIDQHAIQV